MTWFSGGTPTTIEMRIHIDNYLAAAHKTKKHIPRTNELLHELWFRSKARPSEDVWGALGDINETAPKGVINGSSIKSAFRKYLLKEQGGRCCYCRRWLVNTAYAKPIEHVLPRAQYPQYSIDFWNLAVACTDCNSIKTDNAWGAVPNTNRKYPDPLHFLDAFHPRFHRYDDHIRYARIETNSSSVVLYTGLSTQGRQLCSVLLHKVAAKETLVKNNPVLAPAIAEILNFGARAQGFEMAGFEAFREALDRSVLRLLDR